MGIGLRGLIDNEVASMFLPGTVCPLTVERQEPEASDPLPSGGLVEPATDRAWTLTGEVDPKIRTGG